MSKEKSVKGKWYYKILYIYMTTLSMFIRCNICASLGDISIFIIHSVPKIQDMTLNWKQSCNTWLCDLAESAYISTHLTEAYGHY